LVKVFELAGFLTSSIYPTATSQGALYRGTLFDNMVFD